ncbi:CBS domain protein [Leptospira borgpetersenii str. 200701203]|uniref:CBS domain protein n=1 Tax=Leptospira borgpetersenii str. 200701203 TaxID=1193007 RepID=M3HQI2_LEPBO|nr:CBS domain protein [Leptospira borgpetersenii str. 200701203]
MTAKDLMTSPVVFFLESEPISRVQDIFVQKRFRHVPVLDEKTRYAELYRIGIGCVGNWNIYRRPNSARRSVRS